MKKLCLVALLVGLAGCEVAPELAKPKPPGVVEPGASVNLNALVSSAGARGPITWTIEPGGGSVTQSGMYTAPDCAALIAALPAGTVLSQAGMITGTDRVTASWSGGSTVIMVTVNERLLGIEVNPAAVEVPIGGQVQFTATLHFTCHDQTT